MHTLKEFRNGFPYIEVANDASGAKIALQGGHLFYFARHREDGLLWLSYSSDFEKGQKIRGGVPICWPSFGNNNPDLPMHGFVRTMMWELVSSTDVNLSTTELILEVKDTPDTRKIWDYSFHLSLKITVSNDLKIELTTLNTGEEAFTLTQALHTYLKISDIADASVKGLENKSYLDTLQNETLTQSGEITFSGEVDSVYQGVDSDIFLSDDSRTITLKAKGSSSAVVWNPWEEKAGTLSGMDEDDYVDFVCIETANAYEDFKLIEPTKSHTIAVTIS